MNLKLPVAILVVLGLHIVDATAEAQEEAKKKGFQYAKPKEKAAPGVEVLKDAPKAIPVVPGDEESHPVKIWKLDFAGPSSTRRQHMIPIVEDVTLYSNGKMRLHFAMRNLGERDDNVRMNFDRFYLIDYQGETYKPLARDIVPQDRVGSDVEFRAGTKTRFWMEFDAPKKPEKKFKVFLGTDHTSNGSTENNEFPPFIITLREPIFANLKVAAEEGENEEGGRPGTSASPKLAAMVLAMRAIAKNSQRFEGSSLSSKGIKEAIAVAFQPDPDDEDGVIAWLSPLRSPIGKIKLQGWIMPDVTNPSGLIIKMRGPNLTYRFSIEGKFLTGADNKGGTYTLLPVK